MRARMFQGWRGGLQNRLWWVRFPTAPVTVGGEIVGTFGKIETGDGPTPADLAAHPTQFCWYCGLMLYEHKSTSKRRDRRTVDHVVPRASGGGNGRGNRVASCVPCNTAKGALSLAEYRETVGVERFWGEVYVPTYVRGAVDRPDDLRRFAEWLRLPPVHRRVHEEERMGLTTPPDSEEDESKA